jgi:phosphatidylserine/phosphatidylglycerophosphate/cardiolipin synthase-like enzyme
MQHAVAAQEEICFETFIYWSGDIARLFRHAKVMVVDHSWVIIGSANFENRSFSLNDQIVINVCDEKFARALVVYRAHV